VPEISVVAPPEELVGARVVTDRPASMVRGAERVRVVGLSSVRIIVYEYMR
jgi:hypothetical protein